MSSGSGADGQGKILETSLVQKVDFVKAVGTGPCGQSGPLPWDSEGWLMMPLGVGEGG